MRTRRQAGFTLTELMIVVAIVAIVGALAARLYSRGTRGEKAPAFARSLMATLLEARQSAITLGRPTRVTFSPVAAGAAAMTVNLAYYDTTTATATWSTQATMQVPVGMQLCTLAKGISTGTPTCPATAAKVLCLYPNGRADLPDSGSCDTTSPLSGSGATLWFDTKSADKKFRIWVWGLTGMTKMVDTW